MCITTTLEKLINNHNDTNCLLAVSTIEQLEKDLKKLDSSSNKKGYTIPQIDTIGANLHSRLFYQIKNA